MGFTEIVYQKLYDFNPAVIYEPNFGQNIKKIKRNPTMLLDVEDLTRVVISYEIYETSLRRVS